MSTLLKDSYAYCRHVARSRARNFYYSFLLLDAQRRDALCALYAFMRHCDDLSDDPSHGASACQALTAWREALDATLDGRQVAHPVWPALQDAVLRYSIPRAYLHEIVEGVSSDLTPRRISTFEELYRYCYQVASAVGLSILHVFGFESRDALAAAEKCGVAFQLTNILRDVREDADMGRVYLPSGEMERFGVDPAELTRDKVSENLSGLLRSLAERARGYYLESAGLPEMVHPASRKAIWAMIRIYARLLECIEHARFDVLRQRVRLSGAAKCWILVQASLGAARRSPLPSSFHPGP